MLKLSHELYKVLAWLFLLLIIILSLLPGSSIPKMKWQDFIGLDKIAHFIMYGLCFYLFIKAYKMNRDNSLFYISFMGLLLLGLLLEFFQMILQAGRSFDLYDLLANVTGLLTVSLFVRNDSSTVQEL